MRTNYTSLFFPFTSLIAMRPLMPFIEHGWNAAFAPAVPPRAMPTTVSPVPARSPQEEPKRFKRGEEEKEQDQSAEAAKPKSPGMMKGHTPAIIWVRHRRGLAGGRFYGDR